MHATPAGQGRPRRGGGGLGDALSTASSPAPAGSRRTSSGWLPSLLRRTGRCSTRICTLLAYGRSYSNHGAMIPGACREAAAQAMLGQEVSYGHIPHFYSGQYDVGMEYSGYAPRWDEVVFHGDRADGEFMAFWLCDGRIAAGVNGNVRG